MASLAEDIRTMHEMQAAVRDAEQIKSRLEALKRSIGERLIENDQQNMRTTDGYGATVSRRLFASYPDSWGADDLAEAWVELRLTPTYHKNTLSAWVNEMVESGRESEIPAWISFSEVIKAKPYK